jgi:hypothetical protein
VVNQFSWTAEDPEDEGIMTLKMSGTARQMTKCHILKDFYLLQHDSENTKLALTASTHYLIYVKYVH